MDATENRRDFLKRSLALAGGMAWAGRAGDVDAGATPGPKAGSGKSRIAVVEGRRLRNASGDPHPGRIAQALDEGVEALFGAKAEDVWPRLVGPKDTVGIKVNTLSGRGMCTNPEVVEAIAHRLAEAGVPENHIIVWDKADQDLRKGGFRINRGGTEVQCYGTNVAGYQERLVVHRSIGSMFSRILTSQCTKIINVPVLKDHGICGVTLGMKNFFGAIHNPNKYHGNVGDPYIADLNLYEPIRRKTVLTICDAVRGQYEGGPPYMPQWAWDFGGFILGTDPVALDYVGWQYIEDQRARSGVPSLSEAGRKPVYIATAADAEHRLGTNDPGQIEVAAV